MTTPTRGPLTVDRVRELATSAGADFAVMIAYFDEPERKSGHTQYLTWGRDPEDKVSASDLSEEISAWIDAGGSAVMLAPGKPGVVNESFKLDAAKNKAELERLRGAIVEHYSQKADDRCIEDDDRLYSVAGLPPCDRRVGDKSAMLKNCERFIQKRCEGGGWPSYAELEAERDALLAFKKYVHERLDAAGVSVDPESSHKAAGCRVGGRLDELIGERDRLRKRLLRTQVLAVVEGDREAVVRREHFVRAGGDVLCPQCGMKFYDHPPDPVDECLNIICDRTRVKL